MLLIQKWYSTVETYFDTVTNNQTLGMSQKMQMAKYRTSPAENKVTVHFRLQIAMTKPVHLNIK